MSKVSIIIVNYNGKQFNIDCIKSILSQTYQNFEIVFVDNASSDGSLEEVESIFKNEITNNKIRIIKNNANLGFTGGNNIGHKESTGDYICLLNNDTIVPNNWLITLINGITKDNSLGAVGSIILDKGYESEIKENIFNKKQIITSSIFGESVWKDTLSSDFENGTLYTSVISGCCFLYKKEIIDFPFPEFYFAYGEDVFLSWLIIKKGYKLAIIKDSFVNHFGSGSFGKSPSEFKLFYGNRNQIINFLIFHNLWTKIKLFPLFILIQIAHICINSPIIRIKVKFKALKRIINNFKELNSLKLYIDKNSKITEKEFILEKSYKFSDDLYLANFSNIKKTIIMFINYCFKIYIKLFFRIFN